MLRLNLINAKVELGRDVWRWWFRKFVESKIELQQNKQISQDKVSFEVFNAGSDVNNATKEMIVDYILEKIPNGKVKYQEHGSDPRNYRVNFGKVQSVLGFQPKYRIQDGIDELIDAINNHVFDHVYENRNFYGNYEINYPAK